MLDTEGKRIQAHGGSIWYDKKEKVFYFYGENKEFTDGKNGIWTWGVRAYRSKDFYNWEDCGLIVLPEPEDRTSSLNPYTAMLDRPHILFNEKTGKFVCWCKIMNYDQTQTELVLTSDSFLGPYTVVRDHLRPLGMDAGDFDLAIGEDGKGYYLFEKVHTETIIAELTDDYTDVNGKYSSHFPHPYPPYVREATAHFFYKNRHYLLTSGTTGYYPNPSEVAVSDNWHGPYTVLGDPCPEDRSQTSYHSQVSSVFRFPGKKNLYVAVADRWVPDCMDIPYPFYADYIEAMFSGKVPKDRLDAVYLDLAKKHGLSKEQFARFSGPRNTSLADYVWLPLRFEEPSEQYPDGMVFMDWKDEWKIEDFD